MHEYVILVDQNDLQIGIEEKLAAHKQGLLHRAFSIFIFNDRNELLLQKRAAAKYHSGGLWTNTCCSHPRPGEELIAAARRRLNEEMGIDCPLEEIGHITYQAALDHGLVENEFDHILIGKSNNSPKPNPAEAEDSKWVTLAWLADNTQKNPQNYTAWLRLCMPIVAEKIK